jgi:hypothetical protein
LTSDFFDIIIELIQFKDFIMTLDICSQDPQVLEYLAEHREDESFLSKIETYIRTQVIINDIKTGLDEVALFEKGELEFKDANEFLKEL